MALQYDSLSPDTRKYMAAELAMDIANGKLYPSPRLNPHGTGIWPGLLSEAVQSKDDGWLATELRAKNLLNDHVQRRKPTGGYTMTKMPVNAPETLAEGEYNRLYARGLCARCLAEGIESVEVYRARESANPRPESEALIGRLFSARALLEDLRTAQGVEPALGLPPGPNSGLSVRLPRR